MKNKSVGIAVVAAALAAGQAYAAFAGEQLTSLPKPPKGGRFKTPTDLVWPAKPGEADVCLWSGDRFACCSITIDDNCKPDHDWWLKLSDELGIKLTWFVITDHCVKKNNPGFNGTWADWQRLADAGHSIQSHTTNHKATQGGKKAAVRIVSHEGAPYALVEAVPDRGTVRITKSAM